MRLLLRPEAEQDLREARDWYESKRRGLGEEFRLQLRATIATIQDHPQLYAEVFEEVRRAPLRRFPYGVYYFLQGGLIEVLAVLHHARDPQVWQARAP